MSKLTFSSLPDVCLLLVFDKIALDDLLLNVNLVNRHWNTISAVASQHRKRLVLSLNFNTNRAFGLIIDSAFTDPFEVSQCKDRYFGREHEGLIVPDAEKRLNRQSIERLVERLPNISTLEVNLDELDISISEHLATLINGWRKHLVTLKLFTNYWGDRNQSLLDSLAQLTNLHTTINSLPVLQHLTYQLDFPFSNQNHDQIEPFTFPISSSSLKELYFTSKDFLDYEYNSDRTVQQFSNSFRGYVLSFYSSGLMKIACYITRFYNLDDYFYTPNVLSSKTTHLALDTDFETELMTISRKFYNLTHFTYDILLPFFYWKLEKLAKCLSTLENLRHLKLFYFKIINEDEFEENEPFNNNLDADRALPQITPLIQLKSVRLELTNIRWHQFMSENLCFHLVFPNVELISIQNKFYNCIHCGGYFDKEMRTITRKPEWHNCIGPFLSPIAKCDKLKRIEYEDETDFEICCSLEKFKLDWADFID